MNDQGINFARNVCWLYHNNCSVCGHVVIGGSCGARLSSGEESTTCWWLITSLPRHWSVWVRCGKGSNRRCVQQHVQQYTSYTAQYLNVTGTQWGECGVFAVYGRHDEMFDGVMSPSDSQEESQREAGGRRGGETRPVPPSAGDVSWLSQLSHSTASVTSEISAVRRVIVESFSYIKYNSPDRVRVLPRPRPSWGPINSRWAFLYRLVPSQSSNTMLTLYFLDHDKLEWVTQSNKLFHLDKSVKWSSWLGSIMNIWQGVSRLCLVNYLARIVYNLIHNSSCLVQWDSWCLSVSVSAFLISLLWALSPLYITLFLLYLSERVCFCPDYK